MSLSAFKHIQLLRAKKQKMNDEFDNEIKGLEQTLPAINDLVVWHKGIYISVHVLLDILGDTDDADAKCILSDTFTPYPAASSDVHHVPRSAITLSKRNGQFKEMKEKEQKLKYDIDRSNGALKTLQCAMQALILENEPL